MKPWACNFAFVSMLGFTTSEHTLAITACVAVYLHTVLRLVAVSKFTYGTAVKNEEKYRNWFLSPLKLCVVCMGVCRQ